jgi:hypothetical protein
MKNWYLYYRIMRAIPPNSSARGEIQDILIDLRGKAVKEWPGATDQDVQDFFEYLARDREGEPMSQGGIAHVARMEGWEHNEVSKSGACNRLICQISGVHLRGCPQFREAKP